MNLKENLKEKFEIQKAKWQNQTALRAGSYSLAVSAIMLAILVLANVFASALPEGITKLDISSSKLYSITSNTKAVVNNLEKDITIYWIVQSGEEDEVIDNLLGKYEGLSSHIKKIGLLSCVLVVVCIATIVLTQHESKKEEIEENGVSILQIDTDAVTKFSWENEESKLGFHKNDSSVWLYDNDENFPVNEEKINELLEPFADFGSSFTISNVEDFSQYGIDEPICTISIETTDKAYDIKLGDFSTMDSKRYVSIGDGNVYLVNTDPSDSFNIEIEDMIKNDAVLEYDSISKITFNGSSAYSVHYMEENTSSICDDDVYFTNNLPLDTERVEDYLSKISGVNMENYVTYNATDEELKSYGLDAPTLTVTIDYKENSVDTENKKYTLNLSRNPKESPSDDDSDDEEEYFGYVRIGNSKIIYEISSYDYDELMRASYNDLRHKELFTSNFDNVIKIDVSLEGKDYTLIKEKENDITVWKYNDEEIEIGSIKSAIEDLSADSFTSDAPSGKEEISLKLYLDHKNASEISIALYRHDGSKCIATLNGEPVSLISRSSIVDVIEAVNAIVLD